MRNVTKLAIAASLLSIPLFGSAGASAASNAGAIGCITQGGPQSNCVVDGTTATINQANTGAGELVYMINNGISNTLVGDITTLSFSYAGNLAPRLNIPVQGDTAYVFIEGATCNDGSGNVDVIHDSTCAIQYGSTTYPNWAAFVQANPTVRTVSNDDNQPYVIQDTPGSGTISNVQLGQPCKPGKGTGDKNRDHCGAPGQLKKSA